MKQLILMLSFLLPPFVTRAQEPPHAFETAGRKFSNIANFSEGRARVRLYGTDGCGYIDTLGNMVIKPQFEEAERFRNGLALVGKTIAGHLLYGFIGPAGQLLIPYQFEDVKEFSDNRAAVNRKGTWQYINKSGKTVLGPSFVEADTVVHKTAKGIHREVVARPRQFSNGLLLVRKNKKYGYVDSSGHWVIPATYAAARDFSDGVALVGTPAPPRDTIKGNDELSHLYNSLPDGPPELVWSVIDPSGKVLFTTDADRIEEYSNGLALFYKNDAWGFMNKRGVPVFMPQFESAPYTFSGGLSMVQVNGKAAGNKDGHLYILDTTGTIVSRVPLCDTAGNCIYDSQLTFSEGLIAVKKAGDTDAGWGFMDATGKMLIPAQFNEVTPFSEGLAIAVTRNGDLIVIKKPRQ